MSWSNPPPYLLFASPPLGDIAAKLLQASFYPPAACIDDPKISLDDQLELVQKHQCAFLLVVGFGQILKPALLDSVAGQVLNIHPSLLPLYRGPAPVVQAILDGAEETGVTLIQIDAEVDHGPILAQSTYRMRGDETPAELYQLLATRGVEIFLNHIQAYLDEVLELIPQNHSLATFTHFVEKGDGLLDPTDPVEIIERKIRAYQGWPSTWFMLIGKRLLVHKAHITQGKLIIDIVQPENGKKMALADYLAGQRQSEADFYDTLFKK